MYEKFYCLNEKPFNATPDPKFLYLGEHHREALAHLIYGVTERKGFIVLTGEVGAGKTTLIRTLLERLGDNVKTALVFNPNLTLENLFLTIIDEFGLNTGFQTKVDFLNILNKFLIECLKRNEKALLIIDESQNLSTSLLEEIRLLLNLETSQDKLLQIILAGQPELNQKLELPELRQLKQRIGIRYHLPPLTKAETKGYIRERLKIAGSKDFSIFTDKAISEIYAYAKGIPRLVNILCDNSLLSGYAINQPKIGTGIVRECIEDLNLKSAEKWINTENKRKIKKNSFSNRVWQLVLILVFLSFVIIGGQSWDTRRTTYHLEKGREKAMNSPKISIEGDISGKVRKNIDIPGHTDLSTEGKTTISIDKI